MKNVFHMSSEPSSSLGFDIGRIMEKKPTKGDIGIEIECEGNKFPKRPYKGSDGWHEELIPAVWNYHKDGSLRGKDNAEYVLYSPIEFNAVPETIHLLWDMFKKFGTVLDTSNRTSVHVHLNVQRWHLDRLCTFMAMYFSIEEILTQWCGEHRVGNLFCLRAKDAPGIISCLKKFLKTDGDSSLSEGLHYAGFNAHALTKFGSIELRTLRGCKDPETIIHWVEILRTLYEKSADYSDPRHLMEDFSGNGPLAYLERLLGDKTQVVLNGISMDSQEVQDSVYDGIRMAQDLTYCRDWSLYQKADTSKDPFGRLTKAKPEDPGFLNDINTLTKILKPKSPKLTPYVPSGWAQAVPEPSLHEYQPIFPPIHTPPTPTPYPVNGNPYLKGTKQWIKYEQVMMDGLIDHDPEPEPEHYNSWDTDDDNQF